MELKDDIDFGSMAIPRLFRKLLLPTLLGMVFSAAFVITDGIFVGKGIGSDALAAVGAAGLKNSEGGGNRLPPPSCLCRAYRSPAAIRFSRLPRSVFSIMPPKRSAPVP